MNAEFGPRDTRFLIAQGSPLTPPGGKVGGAELVVLEQSSLLSGYRSVGLVCPQPETNGQQLHIPKSLHVELFNAPVSANNDELLDQLTEPKWLDYFSTALNGTRKGEGFLYGHYYVAGGVVAEMRSALNRKFVYMGHSWDRTIREMDPSRKITQSRDKAEQAILRASDAIIVSTHAEKDMLSADYNDVLPIHQLREKIHVVPLGVDNRVYNPENKARIRDQARKQLLPPHLQGEQNTVFYTLGRMSPQKAHLESIQGFAELLGQEPGLQASLSVFGGPLKGNRYFEEQIMPYFNTLPLYIQNRIIFHDRQSAEMAHAAGDIFVGASTWETWFLSLNEAMAVGNPSFISDKPILKEVGGDYLPTVNEKDPSNIAFVMQSIINNDKYRSDLAQYSYMRGGHYSWKASVAGLTAVLDNLQNGG